MRPDPRHIYNINTAKMGGAEKLSNKIQMHSKEKLNCQYILQQLYNSATFIYIKIQVRAAHD